ncbi:MAG: hypothetical protein IMZ44_08230 [Planctomycetes bacterium]|nr:hypothetical protein [Planctomycetota bacterium]
MADKQLQGEERVLRKLARWLSLQLENKLELMGRPEDKKYISRCPSAMRVCPRLDAELVGTSVKVAVEHTTLDAFPKQRTIASVLKDLRHYVRGKRAIVPRGNSVNLSVSTNCVRRNNLDRRTVKSLIPRLDAKLMEYLARLPKNPELEDTIRGTLLEEPFLWQFGPLEVRVTRHWQHAEGHIYFAVEVGEAECKTGLLNCLGRALESKVEGKSSSYEAYRSEGWLVVVLIELADFQICSIESAAEAFRQLAGDFDLSLVDGIVLVSEIDATDQTPLCCWAYFRGKVRSGKQQKAECHQCLGIAPNR